MVRLSSTQQAILTVLIERETKQLATDVENLSRALMTTTGRAFSDEDVALLLEALREEYGFVNNHNQWWFTTTSGVEYDAHLGDEIHLQLDQVAYHWWLSSNIA